MTIEEFQRKIAEGMPLEGTEMIEFMREQSDESRQLQMELNCRYHTPDEIRCIFSKIIGKEVDPSFRLFPPFYSDFGKNIHVGSNVFINSCCQFQDQGGIFIGDGALIGHSVIIATLNHHKDPDKRQNLDHAPVHIGKGVWIGARVHHPARSHHRRQRHNSCRSSSDQGCARQHDCCRTTRKGHKINYRLK